MRILNGILVICLGTVLTVNTYSQDTINVTNITVQADTQKGLSGVEILVSFADTVITGKDDLKLEYTLNGRSFKRIASNLMKPNSMTIAQIFHPISQLFDAKGSYDVDFKLNSISAKGKESRYEYILDGLSFAMGKVTVPEIIKCMVNVDYVEVYSTNSKGKAWDYNFFAQSSRDNFPDMVYTVESDYNENSRGVYGNIRYRSHKQKNTTRASWTYSTDTITYCKGDKLMVCIKDVDTIFDDTIGCFEIDELAKKGKFKDLSSQSVISMSGSYFLLKNPK